MPQDQHRLHKVYFEKLKCLNHLEIVFPNDKRMCAIMGPNGCGKTTVLHALACINRPVTANQTDYKFSQFFTPTTDNQWKHSRFVTFQDYYERGALVTNRPMDFHKGEGRWMPHYARRAQRYVAYLGVSASVPQIELEKQKSLITYTSTLLTDEEWNKIKDFAGIVLNRNYEELKMYTASRGRKYLGVKLNTVDYSTLSMGAGEQRVFHIAEELVRAKVGGLILIEEIELLLHEDALNRMLEEIRKIANNKKLQVVFTSHSPNMVTKDFVAIRYLYQTPEQTFCFDNITDEGMRLLTGQQVRPIKVYVEDELAKALVSKIAAENGMRKQVEVNSFGTCSNLFTLVCGKLLQGEDINGDLFVLDGDVERTEEEKKIKLNHLITGSAPEAREMRSKALAQIKQLILPADTKPEPYYNSLLCAMEDDGLNAEEKEIKECCLRIVHPADSHSYIDHVIKDLGMNEQAGLQIIVNMLSKHTDWGTIKREISDWLLAHKHGE